MSEKSKIEWTDASWNPVTGCTKVSPGCKNCYAERWAKMHRGEFAKDHDRKFTDIRIHPEKLEIPLRWRKQRRIFVNSMSDLFYEEVKMTFIAQVFAVMAAATNHIFQVLTKRPERMYQLLNSEVFQEDVWKEAGAFTHAYHGEWPLPNVWIGVSIENQETADQRIPLLLQTPAAIRWISAEPLLGQVNIFENGCPHLIQTKTGITYPPGAISWLVAGGESGPGARPMHPDWARSLLDQCQTAGVPFFFKQWGEWIHDYIPALGSDGDRNVYRDESGNGMISMAKVGKKRAGRILDGRTWDEMPA